MKSFIFISLVFTLSITDLFAQNHKPTINEPLVFVDKAGVLRYTLDKTEASFFGVNYTVPFAYAYRAHKDLGVDIEKAIRQDVYHMARLGLDAFRVHVWDTEITDTVGNLLENEHLRLFDFLLAELEKRHIRTIITPIAFWGNGYPERDEATPGFSRKYGKGNATRNDTAIAAQENYLRQFFRHVNPYTKLTYTEDPGVIAVELNNEPSHGGPKEGVTAYINRLAAAVRSVGWKKPLYYNISQSPYYADAVAKANIDGVSFQWYPTGLVANHEQKGNYLPHVDHYAIPFDTIPEYHNKSRMVYEFDAADLLQSCMYPAVARSYKEAGFQWVTQFAYDPMAIAYANTEYQTHYLNLAYTPSKAISILVASKAFHKLQRLRNYGNYPSDSSFNVFRVSYRNNLSEMNSDKEFYYSNSTSTKPVNISSLAHIAGVGSSPVVQYEGTGAYFLDKIDNGVWRLEIMPDAITIRDPFERASPKKEVVRIEWQTQSISIDIPELGNGFNIEGLNGGNTYAAVANGNKFLINPGTYLVTSSKTKNKENITIAKMGELGINEFVAPLPYSETPFVTHKPYSEVSPGKPFTINATIVGVEAGDKITVQVNRLGGGFRQARMIPMIRKSSYDYSAEVPAELVSPGLLNYRIIIQKGNEDYNVFPGDHNDNPFAWDNYINETWQTYVAGKDAKLEIFNPTLDQNILVYPSFRRGFQVNYITGNDPGKLIVRLAANELTDDHLFGLQYYFLSKTEGRTSEKFNKLMLKARTGSGDTVNAKVTLINKDAFSFSTVIKITNEFRDIEVPLDKLQPDSMLLLPRPYPGFQPLWFKAAGSSSFKLEEAEKFQITIGGEIKETEFKKPYSMEIESVWLQKK